MELPLDYDHLGKKPGARKFVWVVVALLACLSAGVFYWNSPKSDVLDASGDEDTLRILAYPSFTASWGPGPRLVEMFEEKMRRERSLAADGVRPRPVKVVLLQAEDAGLLLAKMEAFPSDIVLGFDQLGRRLATKAKSWRAHGIQNIRYSNEKFLAFDWAPLGFLYREGEVEPPKSFADLLSPRFKDSIALQDPRSSSPGFQFLNWLVLEMGETRAFEYLRELKPNVHSTSGSWSQAYGLFTRGLAKLSFGYATSINYHRESEKDDRYRFALFPVAHPVQVEFAAIPETCRQCDLALKFMRFLVTLEAQTVIMNRNWMLPVLGEPTDDSLFKVMKLRDPFEETKLDPDQLLKKWRETAP